MTEKKFFDYNKKCAIFLGWKETTDEFKMKWIGCKTKERLERLNPLYIPILQKDDNVLFSDFGSLDFTRDWNLIIETIDKIETIDRGDKHGKFRLVMYSKSCNWNDLPPSFTANTRKEAVIKMISAFLTWYEKQ